MEQVLPYFKSAERLLVDNDFETAEDFDLFLQNVFAELDGMEKRMAMHHDGSQMLEKFIGCASAFQLRVFYERCTGEMVKLCVHRYASHVMEALIKRSGSQFDGDSEKKEGLATLEEMVIRLSGEIGEAFDTVVMNAWGSHVYRQLIHILQSRESLQGELAAILENVSVSETSFLRNLSFDQYGSPALQAILSAAISAKSPFTSTILLKLFGDDDPGFVVRAASNDYASHLIEVAVKAFDPPSFLAFYIKSVKPSFAKILNGPSSNFLLQHMISACHNEAQLAIVLDDLQPHLETLLERGRAGLLVRLVGWSAAHKGDAHEQALSALFAAFHAKGTAERKYIFDRVIRLQAEELDVTKPVNNLGCAILLGVAGLPHAAIKPFLDNILDLDANALNALAVHGQGSRALEAFLSNGCFSDKAVARLIRTLKGRLATLAADRSASHLVERLWQASRTDLKTQIMTELAAGRKRLEDSPQGRLVLRNCRVAEYERRQESWVKEEEAVERKRTYFADIIESAEPAVASKGEKKAKKKKKSAEDSLLL